MGRSEVSALHRVLAQNFAATSENRIHEDSVARDYGFEGGLVPGVTTWAYMVHPIVEQLGPEWLERGTITARFLKPVYEGDTIEIGLTDEGELTATNDSAEVCASGQASLPGSARTFDVDHYPLAPLPPHDERPDAEESLLTPGTVLGTLELGFHSDRHSGFLAEIGEDNPLWTKGQTCHPGFLMRQANFVLSQNVRLGPWIHVESTVQLAGQVHDAERVQVRAKVADEFEKSGHRFVDLDILMTATGSRPVLHARHLAIWKLRKK
jgi:hypothetical protein